MHVCTAHGQTVMRWRRGMRGGVEGELGKEGKWETSEIVSTEKCMPVSVNQC